MLALIVPYYFLVALGVSLGYHRGLAHNSVLFRPWLRRVLTFLGLPAGHPIAWAGTHRFHHLHTDDAQDPHSPGVRGLWFAHCGWYLGTSSTPLCLLYAAAGPLRLVYDALIRPIDPRGHSRLAPDVATDAWLRFMSTRIGFAVCAGVHLMPLYWAWTVGGPSGLALVYGVQVLLYNAGDSVNSLCHTWGHQRYSHPPDSSRNNRFLALLTMGDGWHNNHHAWPHSARHGFRADEWDLTWVCVRCFERWGWIEAVQVPPAELTGC